MSPRLTAAERRRQEREERYAERKEFANLLTMYGLALIGALFAPAIIFFSPDRLDWKVQALGIIVSVVMMGRVSVELFVETVRAIGEARRGGPDE